MRERHAVRLRQTLFELSIDHGENLISAKHKTMLRQGITHDQETPRQIALDDLRQRISKLRAQEMNLVVFAHSKRIEARILKFDGEPLWFVARSTQGPALVSRTTRWRLS